MNEIYLRDVKFNTPGVKDILDIFQGDIEKDSIYWKKYHNAKSRYFKLQEKKFTKDNNAEIKQGDFYTCLKCSKTCYYDEHSKKYLYCNRHRKDIENNRKVLEEEK